MCAGALNWSQLEGVVYAASDFKRGFIQSGLSLHPKTFIRGGVMWKESKDLLDKFFAKKRS
jgi:tRNA(adenine34) deaminase